MLFFGVFHFIFYKTKLIIIFIISFYFNLSFQYFKTNLNDAPSCEKSFKNNSFLELLYYYSINLFLMFLNMITIIIPCLNERKNINLIKKI